MTTFPVAIRPPDSLRFEREKLIGRLPDIIVARGQAPRLQAEHMTAPSSLVQPEKDLAARAVPHMSQSHSWTLIHSYSPEPPKAGKADPAARPDAGLRAKKLTRA
jgi:hypothetical protein